MLALMFFKKLLSIKEILCTEQHPIKNGSAINYIYGMSRESIFDL